MKLRSLSFKFDNKRKGAVGIATLLFLLMGLLFIAPTKNVVRPFSGRSSMADVTLKSCGVGRCSFTTAPTAEISNVNQDLYFHSAKISVLDSADRQKVTEWQTKDIYYDRQENVLFVHEVIGQPNVEMLFNLKTQEATFFAKPQT